MNPSKILNDFSERRYQQRLLSATSKSKKSLNRNSNNTREDDGVVPRTPPPPLATVDVQLSSDPAISTPMNDWSMSPPHPPLPGPVGRSRSGGLGRRLYSRINSSGNKNIDETDEEDDDNDNDLEPLVMARKRTYSFKGEEVLMQKSKMNDSIFQNSKNGPAQFYPMIVTEARCVILWFIGCIALQLMLSSVIQLSQYRELFEQSNINISDSTSKPVSTTMITTSGLQHEYWMIVSIITGWCLKLIPSKVIINKAPGFIFASSWLLLWIRNTFGVLPHLPSRICEYMLGRITSKELVAILSVYFTCSILASIVLDFLKSSSSNNNNFPNLLVEAISYHSSTPSDGGAKEIHANPWFVDFCNEVFINTVFSVSLMVLPVLLTLNKSSQWLSLLLMYPIYSYGVDSSGYASTFTPNLFFLITTTSSQSMLDNINHSIFVSILEWRVLAQILGGGIFAGKIMQKYFPDDPKY